MQNSTNVETSCSTPLAGDIIQSRTPMAPTKRARRVRSIPTGSLPTDKQDTHPILHQTKDKATVVMDEDTLLERPSGDSEGDSIASEGILSETRDPTLTELMERVRHLERYVDTVFIRASPQEAFNRACGRTSLENQATQRTSSFGSPRATSSDRVYTTYRPNRYRQVQNSLPNRGFYGRP